MGEEKQFYSICTDNVRILTDELNTLGITKEDIVSCVFNTNTHNYVLIYYK